MLRNIPITVISHEPITYDGDGLAVSGDSSTVSIMASVQPATADDLSRLPEGAENRDPIVVFATFILSAGSTSAAKNPDIVVYRGSEYEVVGVSPWRNTIISHCRALCVRRDA
jgi:hypothetical protein